MLKSLTLILIIFTLFETNIFACSYAYQYSYFPLGKSSENEWIMIHLEMERNVNTPENAGGIIKPKGGIYNSRKNTEMTVRWTGKLHLVVLDTRTQKIERLETVAEGIDVDDRTYEEELQPYFHQAAAIAKAKANFQLAVLDSIGYCRHDNDCGFLQKEIDSVNVKLYWTIEGQAIHQQKALTTFPAEILEKFAVVTHTSVQEMDSQLTPASMIAYFMAWKPYAIRLYKVGDETLFMYTIGRGRKDFYASEKAKNWQMPSVGSVEDFVEGNDVLYHGQRFDFFYLAPKQ